MKDSEGPAKNTEGSELVKRNLHSDYKRKSTLNYEENLDE